MQPDLQSYVAGELNRKGIKCQLKVASNLKEYARTDAGVVYSQAKDFKAVRDVVSKYRDLHPEAIAEGSPGLYEADGKGNCRSGRTLARGAPGRS